MPEETNSNNKLDELKKLTLGNAPEGQTGEKKIEGSQTKKEKNTQVNADIAAFKEEQRIFTQISSVKELSQENDYSIPESLNEKSDAKKLSAFEKLQNMMQTPLVIDEKKEAITSPAFGSQTVIPENLVEKSNPNSASVSMQSSLTEAPRIIIQKKTTTEQKASITAKPSNQKNEPLIKKSKEEKWAFKTTTKQKSDYEEKKELIEAQRATEGQSTPLIQKKEFNEKAQIEDSLKTMKTPVDEIFETLEKYRKMDLGELSNLLKMEYANVEKIARMFEEDGVIEIEYPTSLTKKPSIILKNPVQPKMSAPPIGEVLETYKLIVDFVPAQISIVLTPGEARPIYSVQLPGIGKYTRRFLFFVKEEVAENMPIELEEIIDPKKSKILKERFFSELNTHLSSYFPKASNELLNMLSGILLHEMYGLGDIEILMGDDMLEEVGINSAKTPIVIYHRVHGWLKTNLEPGTEDEINNFSSQIGRKVGREITILNPILDAHLLSGDRVNATLAPITSEGNTLTIRRFARKPWTIIDFIGKAHTMNSEMAAMLWLAMQYEMNILIAGGTASGKTSALNSLLALVPTYHRLISIEDVREIVLPRYLEWNWISMVTRSPNPEGLGEVTMLDLMLTSLRMRPDRIIVGEIRRKKEAEVLMEAIETGHSIYSTIHANSGYQVLRRLAEPPISIPLMQIELIDLIVVQYRDRKTNKRRTFEIAEIEQTSTGQGLQINTIYKWVPRLDAWERLNTPTKLITLLNLHTGMTEEDLFKEIEDRKQILEWMKRINVNELDTIGFIVKLFYSNPERVKELAKINTPIEKILNLIETEQGEEK